MVIEGAGDARKDVELPLSVYSCKLGGGRGRKGEMRDLSIAR